MSDLAARIIRMKLDISSSTGPKDKATSNTPEIWRGNTTQIQIGIFNGTNVLGVTDVDSITMQILSDRQSSSYLVEETIAAISLDNTLDADSWADDTKQHATFPITNDEMEIGDGNSSDLWIVFVAILTDGSEITLGAGPLKVLADGYTGASASAADAYTKAQSDARYVPRVQVAGEAVRFKEGEGLQLQDRITGKWTTIYFEDGAFAHGPWEDE